jgi:hypothetical protein
MQRFIGVVLGGIVTFVLLLVFAGETINIVSDRNTGYLIAVVLGGIVSWLWPWVIGFFLVRRARNRQQDKIHDEVERQMAEEKAKAAER